MHIILYFMMLATVLLALFFRSRYIVRVACVAGLAALGLLHCAFLMGAHRLVSELGIQHFGAASSESLPGDFKVAVGMVQGLCQGQMTFVFSLFFAFAILALLPFHRNAKREDSPEP